MEQAVVHQEVMGLVAGEADPFPEHDDGARG